VGYEVDNATRGQRWVIVLKKGRRTILQRTKTVNSAGEIRVRKVTSNGSGSERISALARNLNTGERCSVTLRFRG
jgi:translation initiation factor IF-3